VSVRTVCAASARWVRSREPTLSTAIAVAVKITVAAAGPFRFGMSFTNHPTQGMSVSDHIHHTAARRCRTAARQKTPSIASTCGGPHGQPPHQAAGSSGDSSRTNHPTRQAAIGYVTASGSGSTAAIASTTCQAPAGDWAPPEAAWFTWVALTKHSASVAAPSAAYSARRCCCEGRRHAGAGSGPVSTWMRACRAADAIADSRFTVTA
jgi:hypothetical protein